MESILHEYGYAGSESTLLYIFDSDDFTAYMYMDEPDYV